MGRKQCVYIHEHNHEEAKSQHLVVFLNSGSLHSFYKFMSFVFEIPALLTKLGWLTYSPETNIYFSNASLEGCVTEDSFYIDVED